MNVVRVSKDRMPANHTWAIVERDEKVTLYVVDRIAERVARSVLLKLQQPG